MNIGFIYDYQDDELIALSPSTMIAHKAPYWLPISVLVVATSASFQHPFGTQIPECSRKGLANFKNFLKLARPFRLHSGIWVPNVSSCKAPFSCGVDDGVVCTSHAASFPLAKHLFSAALMMGRCESHTPPRFLSQSTFFLQC